MKRLNEVLTQFQCMSCEKNWCIFDAPAERKDWFCPWCGVGQIEEILNLVKKVKLTPEQKQQKKQKLLKRMMKELREEMKKDLDILHNIIYGDRKKQ